jgi:ribosome-associated toxin RatA of RatAB toxin-antitoxin module
MARVWMQARLGESDPESVLRLVTDFGRWPAASESVRSVEVVAQKDGSEVSEWEVTFREGLLRWTERDWIDAAANRARFDLIEGDPHRFSGTWDVLPEADGSTLTFDAEFDLGMPSLAHVLDPIAVEAVEDAIESVLRGLYGDDIDLKFTGEAPEVPVSGLQAKGG